MAEKIIGVFYLTASATGVEIPVPNYGETGLYYGDYDAQWKHAESVTFVFTDLHSGSIELVQSGSVDGLMKIYGTTEIAGLKLEASTSATYGPFRVMSDPPRFLYSPNVSGEPCRVTVILIR
jgi:hypothetical protein